MFRYYFQNLYNINLVNIFVRVLIDIFYVYFNNFAVVKKKQKKTLFTKLSHLSVRYKVSVIFIFFYSLYLLLHFNNSLLCFPLIILVFLSINKKKH